MKREETKASTSSRHTGKISSSSGQALEDAMEQKVGGNGRYYYWDWGLKKVTGWTQPSEGLLSEKVVCFYWSGRGQTTRPEEEQREEKVAYPGER